MAKILFIKPLKATCSNTLSYKLWIISYSPNSSVLICFPGEDEKTRLAKQKAESAKKEQKKSKKNNDDSDGMTTLSY